jgi:putative membrane protein
MLTSNKSYNVPIAIVSLLIPAVVLYLFYLTPPQVNLGFDLRWLPALNASFNFTTAVLLVIGRVFIARKEIKLHRNTMIAAFAMSCLFLLSYVTYHALTESTKYGGEGWIRSVYFFILITHIILAAIIVPLVLFTMTRGLQARYDKHRRVARWTWPLWLYVAVTGVVVYLMLSPYYGT